MRDPRDVLCSVLASNRKRGERPPPADPLRWIGEVFQGRIGAVAESWERRRDRAHLVRYEDLMLEPARDAHRRCSNTSSSTPARTSWREMLASAERSLPGMSEHRTTPDAQASIGRFARDLDPALVEECERRLGRRDRAVRLPAGHRARLTRRTWTCV